MLEAFDGSFFKGRFYARQPEAMIDVGNDREFGFLYQPERPALESVFSRLFDAPSCRAELAQAKPPARRRFSRCWSSRKAPSLQMAVLQRLSDRDPEVREAARALVSTSLDPRGAEGRPAADRTAAIGARGAARGPRRRAASDRQEQPPGRQSRNPGHHPQADRAARGRAELAAGPQVAGARRRRGPLAARAGLAPNESAAAARGDRGAARPPCSAGSVRAFGIRAQRASPRRDGFVSGSARADSCAASAACRHSGRGEPRRRSCSRRWPTTRPPCAGRA